MEMESDIYEDLVDAPRDEIYDWYCEINKKNPTISIIVKSIDQFVKILHSKVSHEIMRELKEFLKFFYKNSILEQLPEDKFQLMSELNTWNIAQSEKSKVSNLNKHYLGYSKPLIQEIWNGTFQSYQWHYRVIQDLPDITQLTTIIQEFYALITFNKLDELMERYYELEFLLNLIVEQNLRNTFSSDLIQIYDRLEQVRIKMQEFFRFKQKKFTKDTIYSTIGEIIVTIQENSPHKYATMPEIWEYLTEYIVSEEDFNRTIRKMEKKGILFHPKGDQTYQILKANYEINWKIGIIRTKTELKHAIISLCLN